MSTIKVKVGIIGGSGLDDPDLLSNRKETKLTTKYGEPSDCLIEGEINGVQCVLLARHGRKHDVMPSNVNYRANVWALKEIGCTHVIASTATGSLQSHIKRGDIVILDSFIDRTTGRKQTFYDGEPNHLTGVCHLPMEPAYCERLRRLVLTVVEETGLKNVHDKGTVVAIEGPRFSSRSESLMYKQWGGDVINMTSVPEVVLAKEAGLLYVSIAMATDNDCLCEAGERVSAARVVETFKKNANRVTKLIADVVKKIPEVNWDEDVKELEDVVKESVMVS